jgi:hypothetical protein
MSKQYLFVGDSNINVFSSLTSQLKYVTIHKFKGVSIKSVVNKKDHYDELLKIMRKRSYTDIFCMFGVVDVNFYYYFKKYLNGELDIFEKMKLYVVDFVKLISELNVKTKHIFGIMPSHVKSKHFKSMLTTYGVFNNTNIDLVPDSDCKSISRNARISELNAIIKKECEKRDIDYCDIYNEITTNNKINKMFRLGHNPINVHANYEYLLLVYLNKCVKFVKNELNYEKLLDFIENDFNKYLKKTLQKNKIEDQYEKLKFNKVKIISFINNLSF